MSEGEGVKRRKRGSQSQREGGTNREGDNEGGRERGREGEKER